MTVGYSLNIERLYGAGIVRVAAKHLLRELAAELGADSHIDAARIADNFILRGPDTSAGVAALAKSLMTSAGVTKCRKGAVTCLELLFTFPPTAGIDPRQYFEQAITWAECHFGAPVLSCVVHMDEGAPHAHALLLPLIDGHMVGSDLHGGKAKLAAMQTSFHEAVGAPHGLPKYVPQKRLSTTVRLAAIALAREKLQANAALTDAIIDVLLVPHAKDPAPLLLALGSAMPEPAAKAKDFVSIMTAVCKPEPRSPIGKGNRKPIGKAILAAPASSLPDTCVGKGIAPSPIQAHKPPPAPASDSTADHNRNRANFVRLAEQREPATGDAQQQGGQGTQNILDTPAADQRQQSSSATTAPRASVQTVSLAHAGAGNLSDTPAAADVRKTAHISRPAAHVDQLDEKRRVGAGAGQQRASSEIRTKADYVPAQPGITENTESVFTSAPTTTATGGSERRRPAQHPAGNGARHQRAGKLPLEGELRQADEYQRHRDGDHLAASWDFDRGEFAPATGPPPSVPPTPMTGDVFRRQCVTED